MTRKLAAFMIIIATVAGTAASLHADGWFWGGTPFFNRMYRSDREIPYFAEHPPVYYSHIVPRTYGQSPYAYWPGPFMPMLTPEPIMVPNPYFDEVEEVPAQPEKRVKPRKKPASTDTTTALPAGGPLVVLNPFVVDQAAVAAQ